MIEKRIAWAAVAALTATTSAGLTTQAQAKAKGPIRLAAIAPAQDNDLPVVKVQRGSKWMLPYDGITRIVPADDDIARGSYSQGKPVIEGVTNGTTTVELYQGDNKRHLLAVQVGDEAPKLPDTNEPAATIEAPVTLAATDKSATLPQNNAAATVAAGRSNLAISLRYAPAEDNPSQAVFTITYSNRSSSPAEGVVIRSALDDVVSYVTGSATGGGRYDASARELVWNIGNVEAGASGKTVSFRVSPVETGAVTYYSVATVEDATGVSVTSNPLKVGTTATPLLTVFALPDRFMAGRNAPILVDVRGVDFQNAVDRLQKLNVLHGREPGRYFPNEATQRAEYAVMTLRGLNLKDLRDASAIKFVLGRPSVVNLNIQNSAGRVVASLVKNQSFQPGERTVVWDGRIGTGFAPAGRYTYVCSAKDNKGNTSSLKGIITIVPQTPLQLNGKASFTDVKPSDWYSSYLAEAEKQNLMIGYPGKVFQPNRAISRVEATAVVVRALGLEDMAKSRMKENVGFLDAQNIPAWANGYVNVATTVAKTQAGRLIVGYPSNFFLPTKELRRDEAALIVQRLIDKETNRRVTVSGQLAPGAVVTINSRTVEANDSGQFSFVLEQNTAEPTTVAVLGPGMGF